jgi:hypothetical protein
VAFNTGELSASGTFATQNSYLDGFVAYFYSLFGNVKDKNVIK